MVSFEVAVKSEDEGGKGIGIFIHLEEVPGMVVTPVFSAFQRLKRMPMCLRPV